MLWMSINEKEKKSTNQIKNKYLRDLLFFPIIEISILFISQNALFSQSNDISVEIVSERTVFQEYEEIEMVVNITNLTSHTIRIPVPDRRGTVQIRLLDEMGDAIQSGIIVSNVFTQHKVDLPAHQLRTEPLDLGGYQNTPPTNYGIAGAQLVPGIYRIQVTYDNINSNVITFRVIQPSRSEMEVLDEIVKTTMGRDPESNIRAAQVLLDKYHHSVYRVGMYLALWISCRNSPNPSIHYDLLRKSAFDFINEKPNSPQVRGAISAFAAGVGFTIGVNPKTNKSIVQISTISDSLYNLKQKFHNYKRIERYIDDYIQRLKQEN